MPVAIHIPTPLRPFTDKLDTVQASGATVGEVLKDLTTKHAGLKQHLYTPDGKLRSFVNIYVGDEDIRYLQKEQTPVADGQTLSIIPSVAGGAGVAAPAAALPALDGEEIKRYSRHLILSEVGMEGQQKLKAAKVLCIGAGGLGSPVAMYLAAAGVGTIGIVDFDTVDLSNLQRQILHGTDDVGRSKLASAKDTLHRPQPAREGRSPTRSRSARQNALDLFRGYDVDRRRHRQLPDPLPGQRRVRAARHPQRLRQHLPLRGPGLGVRDQGRPVLPLPLSGAAAARARARAAPRPACSASCPGWSAPSRPPRR